MSKIKYVYFDQLFVRNDININSLDIMLDGNQELGGRLAAKI